jgi:hypothetical protein
LSINCRSYTKFQPANNIALGWSKEGKNRGKKGNIIKRDYDSTKKTGPAFA